ncbi:MAG: glycosyltransferase [Lachnospiraceae bacterium]|nr:glycosyltransferase [Lachnospiraceae bacterium]
MGILNPANLKKTIYYLKRNGPVDTIRAMRERIADRNIRYTYEAPSKEELFVQQKNAENAALKISIAVPAYRTPKKYLSELIESCLSQSYKNFELLIGDASSADSDENEDSVRQAVNSYNDSRIRYIALTKNDGISENTNRLIEAAEGDYIALLDHDDLLTLDALYEMANAVKDLGKLPIMVYSDEDKCDGDGNVFYEPNFKPDFNLDMLLTNNYICHFLMVRSDVMKRLKLRKSFDGAQDYDLVLRCVTEAEDFSEIRHVGKVLYHWRCHEASTAVNPLSKTYAYEAGKRALQEFADRSGFRAKALHSKHLGFYELKYEGNIFGSRGDRFVPAAVGGRLIENGKVVAGAFDENGNVVDFGLPKGFSGYMHRGVLPKDVCGLDIRCIKVNPLYHDLFKEVTGFEYREKDGIFDYSSFMGNFDEAYIKEMSLKLSKALIDTKKDSILLYLPITDLDF